MKTLLALTILAAAPILAAEGSGVMTDAERAFLIDQLELSKKNMLASINGLTDAQWHFKPAPEVWSVAECAEHIVLAEDLLFGSAQQILKTPVIPRPESSTAEYDKKLVLAVNDRSQKASAPEPIKPTGKFNTPEDAAREFIARRDKSIAYVKTTNDDLRVHATKGPLGMMDSYQFLLLMAVHAGRHTAQIKEVESNPNFPKTTASLVH